MPPPRKRRIKRGFRYHGHYCGPYWSDGKWQPSVPWGTKVPIDDLDRACMHHDRRYALGMNKKQADLKFHRDTWGKGFKSTIASAFVGAQGYLRSSPEKESNELMATLPATPRKSKSRSQSRGRKRVRMRSEPRPNFIRKWDVSMASSSRSRNQSVAPLVVLKNRGTRQGAVGGSKGAAGTNMKKVGPLPKIMKDGVQTCTEQGNVVTAPQAQYIGHATCPANIVKKALWRAIIKRLFTMAKKLNPKWDAQPQFIDITDTIQVLYKDSTDPAAPLTAVGVLVGTKTQEAIALEYATAFESASPLLIFDYIAYKPRNDTPGAVYMNLQCCQVHISSLSQLKMQNRTVTVAADNEADDVNNVPLVGKSYEGKGTGTKFLTGQDGTTPFVADNYYGVIVKGSNSNQLNEPPNARLFENVISSGKAHFEPGEIQTSTLKYEAEMTLQNFVQLAYDSILDGAMPTGRRYKFKKLGLYRFFGLEKMITSIGAVAENDVRIAYEHDLKYSMAIYPGVQKITTTLFDSNIGAIP